METIRASRDNSTQLAQSRLKDLVLYAISEPYFRLRRRLAIAVDS